VNIGLEKTSLNPINFKKGIIFFASIIGILAISGVTRGFISKDPDSMSGTIEGVSVTEFSVAPWAVEPLHVAGKGSDWGGLPCLGERR
jgi:hypothetical protein